MNKLSKVAELFQNKIQKESSSFVSRKFFNIGSLFASKERKQRSDMLNSIASFEDELQEFDYLILTTAPQNIPAAVYQYGTLTDSIFYIGNSLIQYLNEFANFNISLEKKKKKEIQREKKETKRETKTKAEKDTIEDLRRKLELKEEFDIRKEQRKLKLKEEELKLKQQNKLDPSGPSDPSDPSDPSGPSDPTDPSDPVIKDKTKKDKSGKGAKPSIEPEDAFNEIGSMMTEIEPINLIANKLKDNESSEFIKLYNSSEFSKDSLTILSELMSDLSSIQAFSNKKQNEVLNNASKIINTYYSLRSLANKEMNEDNLDFSSLVVKAFDDPVLVKFAQRVVERAIRRFFIDLKAPFSEDLILLFRKKISKFTKDALSNINGLMDAIEESEANSRDIAKQYISFINSFIEIGNALYVLGNGYNKNAKAENMKRKSKDRLPILNEYDVQSVVRFADKLKKLKNAIQTGLEETETDAQSPDEQSPDTLENVIEEDESFADDEEVLEGSDNKDSDEADNKQSVKDFPTEEALEARNRMSELLEGI